MLAALIMAGALLLDRSLGEPRRAHPLAGFGRLANRVETRLNRSHLHSGAARRHGVLAVTALLALFVLLSALAVRPALAPAIDTPGLDFDR